MDFFIKTIAHLTHSLLLYINASISLRSLFVSYPISTLQAKLSKLSIFQAYDSALGLNVQDLTVYFSGRIVGPWTCGQVGS